LDVNSDSSRLVARASEGKSRRLALPYNHDPQLIEALGHLAGAIEELYFAANPKIVASGRHRLDAVSSREFIRDVESLVARLAPLQIRANVLVNPACLGGGYTDPLTILQHLAELHEAGVTMVTLTDLNLATLVRRHLPELRISASTTALINSAVKAILWRDLCGVDDICPDRDVNKRPAILRAIRRAAPEARIRLLVNDHCLPDCALRMQCMNSIAHNSPTWPQNFLKWCSTIKRDQPWVIYSNSMLVPANLDYYESRGLIDLVKIQGRQAPTEYIVALAEHYLSESRIYDPLDNGSGANALEEPLAVFETVSRCARNCNDCNIDGARTRGYENWCHFQYNIAAADRQNATHAFAAGHGF
jgi:collagenase-like PrtC family protease